VSKLGPEEIGTPTAHDRDPQAPSQPVPQTEVGKKEKGPARRAPVLRPRSRPLVRLTRSTSLPRAHTGVADAAGRSLGHLHCDFRHTPRAVHEIVQVVAPHVPFYAEAVL